MKNEKLRSLVIIILSFAILLSACNPSDEHDNETTDKSKPSTRQTQTETTAQTSQSTSATVSDKKIEKLIEETVDKAFIALRDSDFDTVSALTNGVYTKPAFFEPGWDEAENLYMASFSDMTWSVDEVGRVIDEPGDCYIVTVTLTYRDPLTVGDLMMLDGKGIDGMLKPFIDYLLEKTDQETSANQMKVFFEQFLFQELQKDSSIITQENFIKVKYNKEDNTVEVAALAFPFSYYSYFKYIDPSMRFESDVIKQSIREAAAILYENRELTYEEYETILNMFPSEEMV
jgi:hypothetical protein